MPEQADVASELSKPSDKRRRWQPRVLHSVGIVVFAAGMLAWTFSALSAPWEWLLPILSLLALGVAVQFASQWRGLAVFLVPFVAMLIVGWSLVPHMETARRHFAGASLGVLVMVMTPVFASSQGRLRLLTFGYLAAALAMLITGLAALDVTDLTPRAQEVYRTFQATPLGWLPAIRLEMDGTRHGGAVHPNALSAVALLVMPLGVAGFLLHSAPNMGLRAIKSVAAGVILVGALVLVLCSSRTSWIAAWLMLLFSLAGGPRSGRIRLALVALIVAPLFGGLIWIATLERNAFMDKAEDFWKTVAGRRVLLADGLEQLRRSPWTGIGLNEYRNLQRRSEHDVDISHAHNVFLQTALDIGLPGFVAYCGMIFYLLRRARELALGPSELCRHVSVGAAGSLIAINAFGLADAVALGARVGLLQWLSAGLILACCRIQSESRDYATR